MINYNKTVTSNMKCFSTHCAIKKKRPKEQRSKLTKENIQFLKNLGLLK